MKVKVKSCPTLSDPMDCSLPGSSIHGIFQARVLEWGAIAFSEFSYDMLFIVERAQDLDSDSLSLGSSFTTYLVVEP